MSLKPGTYTAHPERLSPEKFADVYEKPENGNLILCMAFRIDDSGDVLKHWSVLAKGGAVNQRTVNDLKERFGWDGLDFFWFETADLSNVQVEAVIVEEPGLSDPTKLWPKIKWINTPGRGGGGGYAPKQVDRRALRAKYGALFRACAGPQPLSGAPKTPPAPPAPQAPPAKKVRPSTLQECWEKFCGAREGESQDSLAGDWYAMQKEVAPGKTQDDFTPDDWGRMYARIEAMIAATDDLRM